LAWPGGKGSRRRKKDWGEKREKGIPSGRGRGTPWMRWKAMRGVGGYNGIGLFTEENDLTEDPRDPEVATKRI